MAFSAAEGARIGLGRQPGYDQESILKLYVAPEKAMLEMTLLNSPTRIRTSDLWFRRAKSNATGTNSPPLRPMNTRVWRIPFWFDSVPLCWRTGTKPAQAMTGRFTFFRWPRPERCKTFHNLQPGLSSELPIAVLRLANSAHWHARSAGI